MNRHFFFAALALTLVGCPTPTRTDTGAIDTGGRDTPMGDVPGMDVPGRPDTPGGRACSVGAGGCDVIMQGCPPMGMTPQGCYLSGDAMSVSTVCAMSGALAEGAPCTNLNDCAEGLACQDDFCREYCCMGATSDCPVGYLCQPYGGPMGVTLPIGICVPPADCEVIPNSGCPMGDACVPTMDGTLLCATAGTVAEDGTCGDGMGCLPGLGCFGPTGGPFTCIAFCELATPMCTPGHTCTMQPAVVGGGFGLCTPT